MAATSYTYSLGGDFPSGVNAENLEKEISASPITIAFDHVDVSVSSDDNVDIWFKAPISAGEETVLDGVVAAHNPVASDEAPTDSIHGLPLVTPRLAPGDGVRLVSHNFCDACSWWQGSTEVLAAATTTGDNTAYDITGQATLIDVRHARLTFENTVDETTVSPLTGFTQTSIIPVVYLDGVPLDQALEDDGVSVDGYTIDYEAGTITFNTARGGGVAVTADFRVPGSSMYKFVPDAGKRLVFEAAEIDLSQDVDMDAPFQTVAYGSHTILTSGAVVPVQIRSYKNVHDFQAAANKFVGPLPAGFGGTGGVPSEKWTFLWNYQLADEFYDTPNYLDAVKGLPNEVTVNSVGLQVEGDTPYGGSVLTITYYAYQRPEGEV